MDQSQNINIGITGASGQIGQALTKVLLLKGYHVIGFDRNKYNLNRSITLKPFVQDLDVLFHLAGTVNTSISRLFQVNTLFTLNLLKAIKKWNREVKLVFGSSLQVYRHTHFPRFHSENNRAHPSNLFGMSKWWAEKLIMRYTTLYKLKSLICRMSNVYSQNAKPHHNSVISTFIYNLMNGKKIDLFGIDKQFRDFIFIDDLITYLEHLVAYEVDNYEIFNLCSGNYHSITHIAEYILSSMNLNWEQNVRVHPGKKNDYLLADPSKIHSKFKNAAKANIYAEIDNIISNYQY